MSAAECRACRGDWPPAETLIADCGPANAYLYPDQFFPGWTVLVLKRHATELWELARDERNALPHIHWHLVPRRGDDPVPRLPVWTHAHEPLALSPAEQRARIAAIRARLRP